MHGKLQKKTHALEEKVLGFIEPAFKKSKLPTIAIFNTLNWKRSGMVKLFLEYTIVKEGQNFTITDLEGNEIPYQRYEQRPEGAYFGLWVEDIPAVGYKTLQINIGKSTEVITEQPQSYLENDFYKVSLNENKGIISSLFDKELQKELIDPEDT